MLTEQTKKIECTNLFGEERTFEFKLLDAESGTWLLHRFGSVLSASYETLEPVITKFFRGEEKEISEDDNLKVIDIIKLLPQVFDWKTVKEISAEMLPGTTVLVGDELSTIGPDGFTPLAQGDPMEQFVTLFYCICANFPKYISFLGGSLDSKDVTNEADEK